MSPLPLSGGRLRSNPVRSGIDTAALGDDRQAGADGDAGTRWQTADGADQLGHGMGLLLPVFFIGTVGIFLLGLIRRCIAPLGIRRSCRFLRPSGSRSR